MMKQTVSRSMLRDSTIIPLPALGLEEPSKTGNSPAPH